jgi:tetratricopeptide (TPR) repeat protein
LGRYEEALAAYQKAVASKVPAYSSEWAIGRTYSQMGQKDKAFEHLQAAIAAGFNQSTLIKSEPTLATLHDDPRFAKLIEAADKKARPCEFDSHYQEFDFWIGEWDVHPANNPALAGTSVIEKILGSCVILENWTGSGGGSGKSFNVYDATTQKWEQIWVDAFGTLTKYSGGIKDGVMDYYADSIAPNGKPVKMHLQFFKLGPDSVRQFNQLSSDGGATWTVGYDFIYTRKKSG